MKFRKTLLATLIAATMGSVSIPAMAAVEIFFNRAPPEARYEATPAPRKGYLWTPGFWDGSRDKHIWRTGHWERERAGHYYIAPRWIERNNGWALERGRWNKGDRDGDGVPNNRDRQPDNPNRR